MQEADEDRKRHTSIIEEYKKVTLRISCNQEFH